MDIKRKDASVLLHNIARLVYEAKEGTVKPEEVVGMLEGLLTNNGLEIPTKCLGEAHSNPHIDGCYCRFKGYNGGEVKVK